MLSEHKAPKEGFVNNEEKVFYELDNVRYESYIGESKTDNNSGKLVLTSERLYWRPDDSDASTSLCLSWREISMHGIETKNECIFAMVEFEEDEGKETEDDDTAETISLKFYPKDKSKLEELFQNFSTGAQMNPDPILEDELDSEAYTIADLK